MQGETATRILQTAHGLIAERGYSAFSYADISDAVHIRKASIHHHFTTKADLVVAVLRRHREGLTRGTEQLNESVPDPLDRLRMYVQHWEGCIKGQSEPFCIAALLAAELPSLPPEVRSEVQQHFDHLSEWISENLRQGVKQGSIRLQGTAEAEAQSFMAIVHGAMISARAYGIHDVFTTITHNALLHIAAHTHSK